MKYLIVFLLFCKAFWLEGQKIEWGPLQQKPDKNAQISQVIGRTSMGIYTLLTDVRRPAVLPPILQRYNDDFKLEKQLMLRLESKSGSLDLERALLLDGRLYLIGRRRGPAGGRVRAFSQEINLETLEPKHEPRIIQEINWVEGLFDDPLPIKISADQRKILVYNSFPGVPENLSRNWLTVFNADLQCEWSVSAQNSKIDPETLFLDYELANNGEVMVLSTQVKKGISRVSADPNFQVLCYGTNGQPLEQYKVHLGNFNLQKAELELDKQGKIICAGLFNDGYQETLGAFASIIDQKTGAVKTHAGHFIDSELTASGRVSKRLANFQFRGLQLSSDGRISLLAEQLLVGQQGNRTYGQVLLLTYPPDLNSRSLINLYKNQVSADYGYFDSFALVAKDEQLVLMYNDKNRPAVFKASLVSSRAEHLTTLSGDKVQICPRSCAALPGGVLWIYAETEDKKYYQVGLLKP